MREDVQIRLLEQVGEAELQGLADLLIDVVEAGASVSFMWPMTRSKADTYWNGVAASLVRGERLLLVAEDAREQIIGTVMVVLSQPENQPHRGDLAKMLVHPRARRRGVGAALLLAAEQQALRVGKTLLVLDTASAEAERLYARQGWVRCGQIPDFALMPDGAPCATTIFYKQLTQRLQAQVRQAAPEPFQWPKAQPAQPHHTEQSLQHEDQQRQ